MSIEGKKVKQHIGKLKETLDSVTSTDEDALILCYRLLIISEISQRGVVVPVDCDDAQLEQAIISTAGKVLLNENQVKPPLIAGAAVVSALIATKLANGILISSENNVLLLKEKFRSAFQRVTDVDDTRLLCLLNLATKSGIENDRIQRSEAVGLLLKRVAFGNNLRAASFSNTHQPPIFKKSLDSCLEAHLTLMKLVQKVQDGDGTSLDLTSAGEDFLSYYTPDSISPLLNLIRIAESKQNSKRVSELSLRITQSYIGGEDDCKFTDVLTDSGGQLWDGINNQFVNVYTSQAGEVDILKQIDEAKKSLEKVNISDFEDSDDLILLYNLLKLRVEFCLEDTLASIIGNERYVAARNRHVSSGTSTKEGFHDIVKRELVAGTLPVEDSEEIALHYDRFSADKAAESLRNEFLAYPKIVESKDNKKIMNSICFNIERQIDRLVMRSQTIALGSIKKKKREAVAVAWDSLFDFVVPLIDALDDGDLVSATKIMSLSQRNLMKTACEGLLAHMWMSPDTSNASTAHINRVADFLSALLALEKLEVDVAKKKQEKVEGKFVSTTSTSVSKIQLSLQLASRAARCHVVLTTIGSEKNVTDEDNQKIQALSEEAIRLLKTQSRSKYLPELDAKFGVSYLLFLVCWSGMFCSPWSFFNVSQARSLIRCVRENTNHAIEIWGRKATGIEEILLDIGEADSECGYLSGGMNTIAQKLYISSLDGLQSDKSLMHTLLKAHCLSCSARLRSIDAVEDDSYWIELAESIKTSMKELQQRLTSLIEPSSFYLWRGTLSLQSSIEYHVLLKMQLVAEFLLKGKRSQDAKGFLEDAAKDSPQNYDVAFSYGSFLLQMALYNPNNQVSGVLQKSQKQLLKAAKLNVQKADPFALLGLWYEVQNDIKRAVGCYSKALLIEPSHPVAGRGVLRLKSSQDVSALRNNAMNQGIFQNGWAWKSFGDHKAFAEGDDERAVVCYQQALRARDIGSPKHHRLNIFFALPSVDVDIENKECGSTWASLGGCYRRLGKHSASVRAFQSASDVFPSDLSYFCSWAQVELELGLLDEAVAKFQQVLDSGDTNTSFSAAYGLASCMLVFARQAADEGKYGDALSCLEKGVKSLTIFNDNKLAFSCVWKLLGDLFSHGSIIPESAFVDKNDTEDGYNMKMSFIAQGEDAYTRIISSIENMQDSGKAKEMASLHIIALNDLAINYLLRSRLRSNFLKEGSGIGVSTFRIDVSNDEECNKLLELALKFFTLAIESEPLLPMSWCGLGTALVSKDPILAQHAFCRALQLDKGTEDAWANLSLLFYDHNNIAPSEEAVDALTQVADSPIIWIVRGLLLEKQFQYSDMESILSKASDAYRASLQISRHQSAHLGLSLTSRRLGIENNIVSSEYVSEARDIGRKESHANLQIFLNSSADCNLGAMVLDGIMNCEKSLNLKRQDRTLSEQAKLILEKGRDILTESQSKIMQLPAGSRELNPIESPSICFNKDLLGIKVSSDYSEEDIIQVVSTSLNLTDSNPSMMSDIPLRETEVKSINAARQHVVQNPDSGLAWLDLSKAMLRSLTPDSSDETASVLKSTIQKTKQIMVSAATDAPLLHPSKGSSTVLKSIPSKPTASKKLSEVFALSDWIEDVSSNESMHYSYDLQRAILLDPENLFARPKIIE